QLLRAEALLRNLRLHPLWLSRAEDQRSSSLSDWNSYHRTPDQFKNVSSLSCGCRRRTKITGCRRRFFQVAYRYGHLTVEQADHHRYKEQSRDGGDDQAANDCSSQRRVLFTTFAESECHGEHANDHGGRSHEHRSESADAGFPGGGDRVESC